MKRIILLAVVAVVAHAAYAQNVQFGVKAGVNLANFNEDISPNSNSKAGLNIGALAHIHLTKNWAVQPEAVYSMQGAEYSNSNTKIKVNYVNIPVLAQYMFANGFRLQTGPQLGILTNSKVEYNGAVEVNSDNNYKSTDFGWSFGAGYLTKAGFGLDARYNLGISDISKTDPSDLKNRVWQFGVFYQFRH
jgi:hypothetical protein